MVQQLSGLTVILVLSWSSVCASYVFRECGGRLEKPRGVIQSPNFPRPFPTPIRCEWVIYNPQTMKTVLYLTQFYLKGHFHVWEYDHYTNSDEYIGPKKLATVNFQERVDSITTYKPYVVVRFSVSDIGNIHARVLEHLIDVYGFNITYEFVDRRSHDRKRTCSLHDCSYLGNCYASADFSTYKCECFDGYFGDECQYGPHCNPARGINICHNGGVCRYFQGSFVNICNCTEKFTGDQCFIPKLDYKLDVCSSLGCEHSCNPSTRTCSCQEDFRLNDDNRTCSHIDRNNVFLKLSPTMDYINNASFTGDFPFMGVATRTLLQKDLQEILNDFGISSMSNFTVKGYSYSPAWKWLLSFRFRIEETDVPSLVNATNKIKERSRIGRISFKPDSLTYTEQPELYLKTVVSSNSQEDNYGNYATEGKFLTLSCIARGPSDTEFKWYKDGKLIRLDLSARDGYQTIIRSSKEKTIRSVLQLERVVPLDRGQFTCQVRDSITSYNGSIIVDVVTYPLVDIDPLAGSVPVNGSTYLICLSPHDTLNTFKYEWFENGQLIKTGRTDKIPEELIPTGSLLYVRYLEKSAKFTCKVTNSAGEVNVTASIYVQPAELSNETCDRDFHDKVIWRATAGRHYDKQRCPAEAGGYATRRCSCKQKGKSCTWEKPNFSECQSLRLVRCYDMLENLRLGYQFTTVKRIFDRLNRYVKVSKDNFYSGDSEMAASILRKLLDYMSDFPALDEAADKISFTSVVRLMDLLVDFADNSTQEEKENLHVSTNILETFSLLASELSDQLRMGSNMKITSKNIDVTIQHVHAKITSDDGETVLKMEGGRERRSSSEEMEIMSFVSRKIQSLLLHRQKHETEFPAISNIHSVYPFPTNNFTSQDLFADIRIPLTDSSIDSERGQFTCMVLISGESNDERPRWQNTSCTVHDFQHDVVTCRCLLPGHYIVTFWPDPPVIEAVVSVYLENSVQIVLIVCSVISLCGIIATLIVYLLNWKKLVGEEYVIHLNFLAALLCVNVIFLVCLSAPGIQTLCIVNKVLLFLFLLVAISFLFADGIHTFFCITEIEENGKSFIKYLIIGWGIPAIATVFFKAASQIFGRNHSCTKLCWLQTHHWEFYAFLIPVLVLFMSMCVVCTLSLRSCMALTEEWKFSTRRKVLISHGKSFILFVLLTTVALLSTDVHSDHINTHAIFLVLFEIILSVAVFLLRSLFDDQLLKLFWTCMPAHLRETETVIRKRKPSNTSFKAYIKPEKLLPNEVSDEQEKFHKHYEEVNRTKYTKERKRHLSSLLGSSTSGYMMDSAIGGSSIYHDSSFYGSESTRETACTDSGVGSENDKFLGNYSSNSSINILPDDGAILTSSRPHAADFLPMNGMLSRAEIREIDKKLEAVSCDIREDDDFVDTRNGKIRNGDIPLVTLKSKYDRKSSAEEAVQLLNGTSVRT